MDVFSEEDVCKLFDDEEITNNNTTKPTNNDITILFSVNEKTNNALAKIQCLPNGFNLNGKRSPSNTTHNVFVSDQLKVQLFNPLVLDDGSSLTCQLFINETIHTEKTFNELHECNLTIPRCNKGGSQGKSRVGYLKLVIQKQGEPTKLVGLSNNFWIRTKTRKETVVNNDKKIVEDKKVKKREYEEDSESSCSSDSKRKKQPTTVISQATIPNTYSTNLAEENQELKKRVAELEKLVSDILTGKLQLDQNQIPQTGLTQPNTQSTKINKPRPSPVSVPLLTSNTFGMCSPTTMMTSSCTSPGLDLSPTFFTSPQRTGFENLDYSSNYPFDDMSDFF